jgi:threonine-phosphate decarboxylase
MHGANPDKLYEQFKIDLPELIIDFSTNTNILESDVSFEIDLEKIASTYPCDDSLALRHKIAELYNLDIENILVSNGVNEVIYLLCSRYKNKRIGVLVPTYPEYQKAIEAYQNDVVIFEDITQIQGVDMVFICSPNNPTGKYYVTKQIEEMALSHPDCEFIIDQSYIDFMAIVDKELELLDNVYLLRSMTKIYHLSGLRIGYTLSTKENISELKSIQPTWSVNGIAQEIALRFLNDEHFINKTKQYYKKETSLLIGTVRELGFEVIDTDVNFFLVKVSDDEALIKYLLHQGIVVRHTRNYHQLNGDYIRVACRTIEENKVLIEALRRYRDESILD